MPRTHYTCLWAHLEAALRCLWFFLRMAGPDSEVWVRFLFENYVLDDARRELSRGGDPIPLEPQVFDLLAHLVRLSNQVVTKETLLDSIWGRRIVSESTFFSRIIQTDGGGDLQGIGRLGQVRTHHHLPKG
jgi:DNA-binding response OmpR family regulator